MKDGGQQQGGRETRKRRGVSGYLQVRLIPLMSRHPLVFPPNIVVRFSKLKILVFHKLHDGHISTMMLEHRSGLGGEGEEARKAASLSLRFPPYKGKTSGPSGTR